MVRSLDNSSCGLDWRANFWSYRVLLGWTMYALVSWACSVEDLGDLKTIKEPFDDGTSRQTYRIRQYLPLWQILSKEINRVCRLVNRRDDQPGRGL